MRSLHDKLSPRLTGLPHLADWATHLGGLPHLSCKCGQDKMRDYMERRVTPPRQVTSPTWGPPPPCKQALRPKNKFSDPPFLHVSLDCNQHIKISLFCKFKKICIYNSLTPSFFSSSWHLYHNFSSAQGLVLYTDMKHAILPILFFSLLTLHTAVTLLKIL